MEARELRLGNIATIYGEEGVVDAQTIYELANDVNEIKVEPIPLTEEWLVRLGFERDKTLDDLINSPSDNFYDLYFEDGYYTSYETDNVIPFKLYYVHQLQNLYFALTGEELTIR